MKRKTTKKSDKKVLVRLRLREILHAKRMSGAEFGRSTGIGEERVSKLTNDGWSQLTREELGAMLFVLRVRPGDLIEAWWPSVFAGALWSGPLLIHLSPRLATPMPAGRSADLPQTLMYTGLDIEAASLVLDHANEIGVAAALRLHGPGADFGVQQYRQLVREGTHVCVGSNQTGDLSEWAVCDMYGVTAFDPAHLEAFPFNFSWGDHRVVSSFGFDAAKRGVEEGIYSTGEHKLVAQRTHHRAGAGQDCGLIVVVREELPADPALEGMRCERCVVVLAGHGRHGTLACAKALVDADNQDLLYPERPRVPVMSVVSATYHVKPSRGVPGGNEVSTLGDVKIVAQSALS